MYTTCWQVVGFSVVVAVLQEIVNYFLIYRTSSYRGTKDSIERATKRLEGLRASASGNEKQMKKKEKHMDSVMKSAQQEMAMIKMKSTFVIGVLLFGSYRLLSSYFDGLVVAKIPFEPYPMFRSITHRGLEGEDWTDCSLAAIYALCASSIRFNLTKFIGDNMGWSAPRSMNSANPFMEALEKEK